MSTPDPESEFWIGFGGGSARSSTKISWKRAADEVMSFPNLTILFLRKGRSSFNQRQFFCPVQN